MACNNYCNEQVVATLCVAEHVPLMGNGDYLHQTSYNKLSAIQ